MDDKCAICLGDLKEDAVMTLCEGQHCFCFGCMCDYYKCKKGGKLPCPSCRQGDGKVVPARALIRQLSNTGNDVSLPEEDNMYKKYIKSIPLMQDIFPSQFPRNVSNCIINPEQIFLFARYGKDEQATVPVRTRGPAPRRQQVLNEAKFFICISIKINSDMVCANAHESFEMAKDESNRGDFDVSFVLSVSETIEYMVLYQHKPTILHMTMTMDEYTDSLFTSNPNLGTNILDMVAALNEDNVF